MISAPHLLHTVLYSQILLIANRIDGMVVNTFLGLFPEKVFVEIVKSPDLVAALLGKHLIFGLDGV
jgi:hypothetical protein